jgi:hypothetical protein
MPQDNHDNQKLLRMWNSVRPADSFAYEYHFMTMWIHDHLSVKLPELIPRDVEDYARHGINGIINCCTQRAFYPNGWSYHVMARTLFGRAPGEDARVRYFRQAYGEHARVALGFLDELARLSPAPIHRLSWWDVADMETVSKVLGFLSQKESCLDAGLNGARTAEEQRAWRLLLHYRRLLALLWSALREKLSGRPDAAEAHLLSAKRFLQETEAETASALDTFLMLQYLERLTQSCAERSGQPE